MEKAEYFIELMQKKRTGQLEKLEKLEMKQKTEHNNVLNKIRALGDERVQVLENIARNLKSLVGHKHSIHKILQDSKNISGLPISTNYQKQAITLFMDAIQFIDDINNVLESCKGENSIDPIRLTKDIVTCIESVGNKVQEAKTCFMLKDALEVNVEFLQEQNLNFCEEHTDLDGSVFGI